jgi:hypothetical protein
MKWFVNWVNKHWTHNRDKVGDFGVRATIHIPVGILCSIPVWGWALSYLFYKYQRNEDVHTEDEAWKDIFGALVGYVVGLFLQVILVWRYFYG